MHAFTRARRSASRALCLSLAGGLAVAGLALSPMSASAAIVDEPISDSNGLTMSPIGTDETGTFDESAAEIVHYYAGAQRLLVVSAAEGVVRVLDASDPTAPTFEFSIQTAGAGGIVPAGAVANSVAVRADGLGVIAVEAPEKTDAGWLVFFDANAADGASAALGAVQVGSLPDMVTITPDGTSALVANEGEPADDFGSDPEGSISIVALPETIAAAAQSAVRTANFHAFEAPGALDEDVRVFGPTPEADYPVSRNLEPEYIAVDASSTKAYAALQEANAMAVIDIASGTVEDIWSLGFIDYSQVAFDPSDRDGGADLRTFDNVYGVPMPDAISSFEVGGETYLLTANEGDSREWGDFVDAERVKDLDEVEGKGPAADSFDTSDEGLGRLEVITDLGFDEATGTYTELYAFGGRSFSIYKADGTPVYNSGSDFESITSELVPDGFFNSTHSDSDLESRSDAKGPEPEGVTIGQIGERTYAFIGFERVGGVIAYDITDPANAEYVGYVNNRDFSVSAEEDGAEDDASVLAAAGDLGPEGLEFISAAESPNGMPLVAVGNEVSGTTTLFQVTTPTTTVQVAGINDFHGRIEAGDGAGAASLATAIDELESANPNTLFVSAGDNIGASTFTSFSQDDDPTIDALVAAGLDVSAVGNHEFDQGYEDLVERVLPRFGGDQYGLGANVYYRGTDLPALPEYAVETVDGVRVGFVGVVTEQTASLVSPDGVAAIEFGDPVEAANRVAAELSDGDDSNGEADVVVLLAHEGAAAAAETCEAIAGAGDAFADIVNDTSADVDAILSGHTHVVTDCAYPVEGLAFDRPVLQSGQYGAGLDLLTFTVDNATGAVTAMAGERQSLLNEEGDPIHAPNAEVQAIVDAAAAAADEIGSVQVGEISADIARARTSTGSEDRGSESSLGNFVADMQLWATSSENANYGGQPTQLALMNPGGLRADLTYAADAETAGDGEGVVTYSELASVQPFANTLFTMDLTGAQLKSVLEEQWQPDGSSRPKLHLGVSQGFSYEYEVDAARGAHIVSMTLNGAAVQPTDVIRVVTNSFLAAGGDNFGTFVQGTNRADSGLVDLAAAVDYFEAQTGTVDPASVGRAVIATDDAPGTGIPGTGTPTPGNGGNDSSGGDSATGDGAASASDDDQLAFTGANVAGVLIAGLLLLVGGVAVVVLRRRKATS